FTGPNGEDGKVYSISNEDNGASQVKPDSEGRWPVHADDNVMESHYAAKYPEVADGEKVDWRGVIDSVDNLSSIAASFPNYIILDGIRKVDFDQFDGKPDITSRTKRLAAQIDESKRLMPLIVGIDHKGPFIMEGSHRYDALKILGAKEIPAVVALDLDDLKSESKPSAKATGETEVPGRNPDSEIATREMTWKQKGELQREPNSREHVTGWDAIEEGEK